MAFGTGRRRIKKDASANDPIIRRWLSDLSKPSVLQPHRLVRLRLLTFSPPALPRVSLAI
jgi:hypothetical protein